MSTIEERKKSLIVTLLGGPGSGPRKGFSRDGVKQIDHYAKGQKDVDKLPERVKEFPVSYEHERNQAARKYADKIAEKHPGDYNAHSEYHQGMEDRLFNNSAKYAVHEYRENNDYHQHDPVSPKFENSSQARHWMENNLSDEQQYHGGAEGRGHVVRRV